MTEPPERERKPGLPVPWLRSQGIVPRRVLQPLERFLHREMGSASVLMAAALTALVWANVAPATYEDLWETRFVLDVGVWRFDEDLRHVVNDVLMAIFFFVVALEVKRELVFGSLRDRRSAAVPTAAAVGTMVGAALTYVAVNLSGDGDLRGWAIPIATDIAFALGVLGLAGRRAPRELRAFMLTLAVVDDLGTILVIAVFFSNGVSLTWLGLAATAAISIVLAERVGIRSLVVYGALAALLWVAVFESGVHATIAGVVLGFLTPAAAFHSRTAAAGAVRKRTTEVETERGASDAVLLETSRIAAEAVSPLTRMEERVHPWSAYAILPIFALANAGVPVSLDVLGDALTSPVGLGIALGLVVGAPLGGFLFAFGIVRGGVGRVPDGLDWAAIAGVTPLKGIGFTIAIFISALAFDDIATQELAKLAILLASAVAAVLGLGMLLARHALSRPASR
ncbi:MAG TPA: Na+/H+ antiporter NhaA [Gaiellaceae bacterium]|nr:Na+/H+ antiporter NhaA [Gaiellaceae bacterium]